MKYQEILVLCFMLRHALAEHWEFGVDPPDSEVLDKQRGEISILETIIRIELNVPKCYQIDFVSVNVHNLISNPITTFDKYSNTVVITYKPWQISSSTYDVVAKGTRKPHCRQPLLIKGRYKPSRNTLKKVISNIGTKFSEIDGQLNVDSSNEIDVETQEATQKEIYPETQTTDERNESDIETDGQTDLESKLETEVIPTTENTDVKSAEEAESETKPIIESSETQLKPITRVEAEVAPDEDLQAATELTKLLLDKLLSIAKAQTSIGGKVTKAKTEYEMETEAVRESDIGPGSEVTTEIQFDPVPQGKTKTRTESDTEELVHLTSMLFNKLKELVDAYTETEEPDEEDLSDEMGIAKENIARQAKLKSKATAKFKRTSKRSRVGEPESGGLASTLSYLIPAIMGRMS